MSNNKELVLSLRDQITDAIEVTDGLITDKSLIVSTRPEGLTEEQLALGLDHARNFAAASRLAVAEVSAESGYTDVSATFSGPHIDIEHNWQAKVEINGEEKTNYMTTAIMHVGAEAMQHVDDCIAKLVIAGDAVEEEVTEDEAEEA